MGDFNCLSGFHAPGRYRTLGLLIVDSIPALTELGENVSTRRWPRHIREVNSGIGWIVSHKALHYGEGWYGTVSGIQALSA